ncbi:MAG: hypothetical protein A2161_09125 [Candidatus Schekmanbacteria bacterium RBG_13_48_7]|uniref:Uncharacterized protein n=1 Tax=Candidatus Schekmanbacteria bacterium RBG_13_48_7 TaxID=1817878 RepID=A0A1F7S0U0_9BACT|nr:MAG: hypothetical protein A2161_09125 [Candidatus Schekmanbacteria bacterium RBG_13_48_7]
MKPTKKETGTDEEQEPTAHEGIPFVKRRDLIGHNLLIVRISNDFLCPDKNGQKNWVKSFEVLDREDSNAPKSFLVNSNTALDQPIIGVESCLKLVKSENGMEYFVWGPPHK